MSHGHHVAYRDGTIEVNRIETCSVLLRRSNVVHRSPSENSDPWFNCETGRLIFFLYGRTLGGRDQGTIVLIHFFLDQVTLKPVFIYVIQLSLGIFKVHNESGSLRGIQDHRALHRGWPIVSRSFMSMGEIFSLSNKITVLPVK